MCDMGIIPSGASTIMAAWLAGWAALAYGVADFCGGFASRRSPVLSVLLASQVVGVLTALALIAALGGRPPAPRDLGWGFLAGLIGAFGLFLLYRGIARSIVAIVAPASAVVGAVLPVAFGLALGERPPVPAILGCALCLPAILLLSWEGRCEPHGKGATRAALGYGTLAGLTFGGFFIALSRTGHGAGAWPLVAARVAAILAFGTAMAATRQRLRIRPGDRILTLVTGTAHMGANFLFLLAAHAGMLSLAAVITSLYPAPTVVLARVFLRQRVPPARMAGLALALAGVALISLK